MTENTSPCPTGWIVVNIGCIECGVSSDIVGVYATQAEAEAVVEVCAAAGYARQASPSPNEQTGDSHE